MSNTPTVPQLRVPRTGRPFGRSVAGSAIVHALIILALLWPWGRSSHDAAGLGPGPAGGGGGGGGPRVEYVELPAYQPSTAQRPAPTPAVTQPFVPPRPQITPPPMQEPLALREIQPVAVAPVAGVGEGTGGGPGRGTGSGGGQGAGQGTGRGNAQGPGTGGGGGDVFPPSPKYTPLFASRDVPGSLHGTVVKVRFWVDTDGQVERVALETPINDAGFRSRFLEYVRSLKFFPATTPDGAHVAAEATVEFTLW